MLSLIGAGCSSATSRRPAPTTVPPTEVPITAAPIGSLGSPLPTGPAAPPTTSSLDRPVTTTTTPAPGPAVSATHDPATPDCPALNLSAAASTDHPSYPSGATVVISVSVLNNGPALCQFRAAPVNGGVVVQQSAGRPVWQPRQGESTAPPSYYRLTPRQPAVVLTLSWDQGSCPPPCTGPEGSRLNPGSYRAVPQISGVASVHPAPFTLT